MRTTLFFALQLTTHLVFAQWNNNTSFNNPVSVEANDQRTPKMITDGNNGAIIIWEDSRNGLDFKLYAQHLNANGNAAWATNGIVVCPDGTNQFHAKIISDGAGGAFIVFEDGRNGFNNDIYAQHIDANGNTVWGSAGVAICTAINFQYYPALVSDNAGGLIITWWDNRNGSKSRTFAQHIDSGGNALWSTDGIPLTVYNSNVWQEYPEMISDGNNSAIITWRQRSSPGIQNALVAQKVDFNGVTQWGVNGTLVCANTSDPAVSHQMASNGLGGAIITWQDYRSFVYHIYAQNVASNGQPQWTVDGVNVCNAANWQINPKIISDAGNGAILTWNDGRSGDGQVYAQRITATGAGVWATDGLLVCGLVANQNFTPQITSDNNSGAIICWQDFRGADPDIYAQHINAAGVTQWISNGSIISSATGSQGTPAIIYNSNNSSIIAWTDFRGADADIYASRVSSTGILPVGLISFTAREQNNFAALNWQVSNQENITNYIVEKSIDGRSFTAIANVAANSNSTTNNYFYKDENLPAATVYYRLKIINANGQYSYSSIVRVRAIMSADVKLYPNPVKNMATIELKNAGDKNSVISLYSEQGIMFKQWTYKTAPQIQLDISAVPAGIYTLHLTIGEDQYNQKLVIIH